MKAPAKLILLSATALMALSACKKAPESTGAEGGGLALSGNEVESAANALKLDPGEWEVKVETLDMQAPGMPEDVLRSNIGKTQTIKVCLNEEEGTNPGKVFLKGMDDANCAATKMTVADGKVEATMDCPMPGKTQGQMHTNLSGTYATDRYDLEMNSVMDGLPNDMRVTVKAQNTGKRLGPCDPAATATD